MLKGKVALLVGASTGLGRTCALRLVSEGAKMIIADINKEAGEETARRIQAMGGQATFIRVDVTSIRQIEYMVNTAAGLYGTIDIFWHNAGVIFPGHIETVIEKDYELEMAVGLKAAVFGTKFIIPVMKKAGGGTILYTSSMVGLRPTPYKEGYSLTHGIEKAGIVMLMRCVTEPLSRYRIRVNCICPDPVATEQWKAGQVLQAKACGIPPDEYIRVGIERLPIKRLITEDEVAEAVLFLISDRSPGITGIALPIDGGFTSV